MKKIILSLLIIFISMPAPAASAPKTANLEITVLYGSDKQPSASAFIKNGNADTGWQVDTNGKFTTSNVSTGQEYTISEMGRKNITYIVAEGDMQKQSDDSYLIKKTFYLEPDDNNTITASKIRTCTEKELTKLNATNGHVANNKCQPTKCIEPRYELFVVSGSMKDNPDTYLAQCTDLDGTDCYDMDDIYALDGVYKYDKKSNELNCVSATCQDGYRLDKKTKKCITNKCPCGQEEIEDMCIPWLDKKCTTMPANAATAERACDGNRESCKILTCNGDKYKNASLHEFELDTDKNKCVSRVNGKCTPTGVEHATAGKYKKSDTQYKLFCAVTECEATYTPNDDGTACESSGCTKEQEDALKAAHATRWKFDKKTKKCIVRNCENGYNVDTANNTCVARDDLLSEKDSQDRIDELRENEKAVAENAQTWENKLLGTAGIGGAGAGGQMLASGIAQKTADEAAERDMTAYLATFRCKYGNESVDYNTGEIQLPGANDKTYASLLSEYKTLAASLKMRKNALGMAPGIESNEILDGSSLYNNVGNGGADGAYMSLADALSGDADARAEWDEQKEKARDMAIGGGVLAGGAIIGTAIGSAKVNKDAPKNKADEINKKYDVKRGTIVDEVETSPAPQEGTEALAVQTANQATHQVAETKQ